MAARELTTCGSKHPLIIGSRVPEYLPGTDRIRGLKKNVQSRCSAGNMSG